MLFSEVLPRSDYPLTQKQISLAEQIMYALCCRSISIMGVGDGNKEFAYLIPAVTVKFGRLNDSHNLSLYPDMPYAGMAHLPIVFAISSNAPYKSIVEGYIPALSQILTEAGVIKRPLTAALRKSNDHLTHESGFPADIQVCSHHYLLADTIRRSNGKRAMLPNYQILIIDDAKKFHAAAQCMYRAEFSSENAPKLQSAMASTDSCFFTTTTGDLVRKSTKKMVDESNKLFRGLMEQSAATLDADAARHLRNIRDIADRIALRLRGERYVNNVWDLFSWVMERYSVEMPREFYDALKTEAIWDAPDKEAQRRYIKKHANQVYQAICALPEVKKGADIEKQHRQRRSYSGDPVSQIMRDESLERFGNIWDMTKQLIAGESVIGENSRPLTWFIRKCEAIRDHAAAFVNHGEFVCRIEPNEEGTRLIAEPKNLDIQLYNDLWSKGVPTIILSDS
jgi:hypothetical protein